MTTTRTRAGALLAILVMTAAILVVRQPAGRATTMSQRQFVRTVKRSPVERLLSGAARTGIRLILGKRQEQSSSSAPARRAHTRNGAEVAAVTPQNVLVNDPSGDGAGDPDMTTQSEVSIAVSGDNVVAAYNDDGRSPRPGSGFLSPATDLSGYSWSDDDGDTWHDSQLPNNSPRINSGDPVLAADRAGHFYYADLSLQYGLGRIDVAVGRSDDGGQTFHNPKTIRSSQKFALADKPWMTVGPDPANPSADVVYVGWEETYLDRRAGEIAFRILVSTSHDLGATWSRPAQVFNQPFAFGRRLSFVNGTSLAVDPVTGRLYVAWERYVEPPHGGGRFPVRREWIAHSNNGGVTFRGKRVAARVSRIGFVLQDCGDTLQFHPGRLVRVTDFPSLGVGPGGSVLMAFNSSDGAGSSRVVVARSLDGGGTWSRSVVAGGIDSFMPDLSADATGASVVYYQRAGKARLRTELGTSADGVTWATQDLSDTTFPVPITYPQFDPFPAPCYMGDYVASLRSGGTTYTGWGDNRDIVTNTFWPNGRPDPDVYFAKI